MQFQHNSASHLLQRGYLVVDGYYTRIISVLVHEWLDLTEIIRFSSFTYFIGKGRGH